MAWWTWGHWGDFQIDSGRELYVPAEILKGKLLFRDLWYMYGPLAPYVKAFLFWIFGVKLNVLFSFGLAMAFTCALLTFEVARRFGLGPVASAVPALYFVLESFDPNIRNFVYPYAYAASLACVLGMACLYFASRHATEGRTWQFALASVLGSLVVLTKQEFGIACLALLGFDLAARYWARRDASEFFRNVAICVAALLPAAAVYGWFIWTLSPREFFYVNWIATPGSFFMHTFGKISIPAQGMRFVPRELLLASELLLLVFAEWALISRVVASSIQKWDLTSRWVIAGLAMAAFLPAWIGAIGYRWYYPWTFDEVPWAFHAVFSPMSEAVLPHGVFFPVPFFAAYALWKLVKAPRNEMALLEAMLGIYAFLVGLRMMMSLRSTPYEATVFFNGPTVTIFFLLIYRVIRWACQSLDEKRSRWVVANLLIAETACCFILFLPRPSFFLPTKLTTPNGSFYTRTDAATIFPQIISFMKSHTRNGKDILVVPEPPSLYTFAGMDAPSRWYALVPGYVAPEDEHRYIEDMVSSDVRYVLLSNRDVSEYKVRGLALGGYNPTISDWIMKNFARIGQLGPIAGAPYPPYTMWIYERKDLIGND